MAGVALFAVARVAHAALALMNPEGRVDVESASVSWRDTVRINWSLTGRVGRIRRLTIAIEAREELEYRGRMGPR